MAIKNMHNNFVIQHDSHVSKSDRNRLNNHKSGIVWFTGLSASGKSTIAHLVERELFKQSIRIYVLDGDNVRQIKHFAHLMNMFRQEVSIRLSKCAKKYWRLSRTMLNMLRN